MPKARPHNDIREAIEAYLQTNAPELRMSNSGELRDEIRQQIYEEYSYLCGQITTETRERLRELGFRDEDIDDAVYCGTCMDTNELVRSLVECLQASEASDLEQACHRFLLADKKYYTHQQITGSDKTNQRFVEARDAARRHAGELWAADTEQEYTKTDIIRWCSKCLEDEGMYKPTPRTLWNWLGKDPSVIPDYVTRPGRRKD